MHVVNVGFSLLQHEHRGSDKPLEFLIESGLVHNKDYYSIKEGTKKFLSKVTLYLLYPVYLLYLFVVWYLTKPTAIYNSVSCSCLFVPLYICRITLKVTWLWKHRFTSETIRYIEQNGAIFTLAWFIYMLNPEMRNLNGTQPRKRKFSVSQKM